MCFNGLLVRRSSKNITKFNMEYGKLLLVSLAVKMSVSSPQYKYNTDNLKDFRGFRSQNSVMSVRPSICRYFILITFLTPTLAGIGDTVSILWCKEAREYIKNTWFQRSWGALEISPRKILIIATNIFWNRRWRSIRYFYTTYNFQTPNIQFNEHKNWMSYPINTNICTEEQPQLHMGEPKGPEGFTRSQYFRHYRTEHRHETSHAQQLGRALKQLKFL